MVLIAIAGASLPVNTLYVAAGATQCAAVSRRSRVSAAPVQTLARAPAGVVAAPPIITSDRPMPSAAGVAPPTIARAGAHKVSNAARIGREWMVRMKTRSIGLVNLQPACPRYRDGPRRWGSYVMPYCLRQASAA